MLKAPPFIVLPLTSSSPPFCHGIASPHSFLAYLNLVQLCLERSKLHITVDGMMVHKRSKSRHLSAQIMDRCDNGI